MNTTTAKPRVVLAPDIYDTLELSALAFGGIGAGRFLKGEPAPEYEAQGAAPVCAIGHAIAAGVCARPWEFRSRTGFGALENDTAVYRINTRKGKTGEARVTFEEWCAELNVVRGEVTP